MFCSVLIRTYSVFSALNALALAVVLKVGALVLSFPWPWMTLNVYLLLSRDSANVWKQRGFSENHTRTRSSFKLAYFTTNLEVALQLRKLWPVEWFTDTDTYGKKVWWCNGRVLDLRSWGRGFDSRSGHYSQRHTSRMCGPGVRARSKRLVCR